MGEGLDGGKDGHTWPLDESFHLSILVYHCLWALWVRINPFDPPPPPFTPPSHPSLPVSLRHPLLPEPTHRLHLLCPPEGIIFTLTTSINLTPSCTQTHMHPWDVHACTHTHAPDRPCLHISPPISITGVKVTGLGDRSLTELLQ